ncbi:anti-sigma factor [Paenibacillus dokdonensis]|uniref:anti-sigma factor n=1 Tax=Paenibacillus dokdonensis TaxID=2567944 RepID=UPI0010A85BE2|nr:anti-sigma factor [Paenibacillus dokdonensis]
MSDDFKRRLQDYRDGKLPDDEKLELEQELEKMEVYQSYLDNMLDSEENKKNTGHGKLSAEEMKMHKREARLLRRGKWKARFGTVLTLISLFIWFTFLSSIGSAIYFSAGDPDRNEVNKDVVESAIAVGYPNIKVNLSSNAGSYFNMKANGKMMKRVGDENLEVGDFSGSFLFSWLRLYDFSWSDAEATGKVLFQYPGYKAIDSDREWKRLEKLPEGTVTEAYVSYKQLYSTDDFLKLFKGKPFDPLWFAVDNGGGSAKRDYGMVTSPIGFSAYPIWHPGDGKVTSSSKQKTGLFTSISTTSTSYPGVDSYGSGELRNENFINTLRILEKHKLAARSLIPFVDISDTLNYVEKNGVKIYGAVVTGPTKEILKLKNDPAVSGIHIGKVTLWNWSQEQ